MQQVIPVKDKRRGAILILAALMCLVLIPITGLIVDGSNAYMMRLELSSALDAAVLAGARSLSVGANVTAQSTNATTVATSVFNANVAAMNGKLKNVSFAPVSPIPPAGTYVRTVSANASASLPLSMMGILGFSAVNISLSAKAQRRDVNVMLVLDHSGSMSAVMSQMQTDASDFVNMFASGRDHLGLVTFGGGEFTAYTPKTTFLTDSPNVPTIIGQIAAYGATNTASAVWAAYQQLVTLNEAGAVNVVVLFTDGQANTFTGNFTSLVSSSAHCSNITSPLNGAITVDTSNKPYGLLDFTYSSLNDQPETRGAPNSHGCTNISNNGTNLSSYLTGMPSANIDGNSTNGTGSIGAYLPVNLSSIDATDLTNAALDTLDDASNRIRSNTTIKPVIYTIGLGGNPGPQPDNILMARMANDPSSPSYNRAQPVGYYVYSPTIAELHTAFLRVASMVIRLAQ
jgi:Flp pilus assembly protein TadG